MSGWRRLWRRTELDRQLEAELQDHLDRLTADYVRTGLPEVEARRRAQLEFGGLEQMKEASRDVRGFSLLDDLARDTRHALRSLGRSPGFAVVAILTLAVGIGTNTAIFSLVNAVRAGAVPYEASDRLVLLWGNVRQPQVARRGASLPDFLDWRAQSSSFEDLAAFDGQQMTLLGGDEPERITVEFVSPSYFPLLRTTTRLGRTFAAGEDLLSSPTPVVVIGDGLWKRRYGSDPRVVGQSIALGGGPFRDYTIVGVMPPGFRGLTDTAELWLPFSQWAPVDTMHDRGARGFPVLARLRHGVGITVAQDELHRLSGLLAETYADTNANRSVEVARLDAELFQGLRPALRTLMLAVALVLGIACVNVANLSMTRLAGRQRDTAVRRALGATRARLLRQLVTESCVLAAIGAACGLVIARMVVPALVAWSPIAFPSFVTPSLDWRVALFTTVVSLLCGVSLGLVPGLQPHALRLVDALKDAARMGAGRSTRRLRDGLTIAEIALAIVLLVAAGLLIRSVRNLAALDLGFDPDTTLAVFVSVPRETAGLDGPPRPVVGISALLERLETLPGVTAASVSSDLPFDGRSSAQFFVVEGQPPVDPQDRPRAYQHRVSPAFFRTLGIPLVRGRTFAEQELTRTPTVVVVSEGLARRFWPGGDPIGQRLRLGSDWLTIIGVAGDVRYRRLRQGPDVDPDVYLPWGDSNQHLAIALRATGPPASLAAATRAAIRDVDRSIAISRIAPMRELSVRQASPARFLMWLMGAFAVMALFLAAIGIYGVVSYLVSQRTSEIGVRMALGADRRAVRRLMLRQSAWPIAIGLAVGLGGAMAVGPLLQSQLFGVAAFDLATLVGVAALFGSVAMLASYVPARRATRIDPLSAIRTE